MKRPIEQTEPKKNKLLVGLGLGALGVLTLFPAVHTFLQCIAYEHPDHQNLWIRAGVGGLLAALVGAIHFGGYLLCISALRVTVIPIARNPPGASALRVVASRLSLCIGGSLSLAVLVGLMAEGLTVETAAIIPGVVAITFTVFTTAFYVTLYSLSLPLIGLFLLLRGGFREAVVAARTSALRGLPPALEAMLSAESIAKLLGGGVPDHKEWSLTLWEDRLLSTGAPLSVLGLSVGLFGGPAYCGLVQDSVAHGGTIAAVGIAVGILGAFMTSARGSLGAVARRQLQERHQLHWTRLPDPTLQSLPSNFYLLLPSGAQLLWHENKNVTLALSLDSLPFRLGPVERKTLGQEKSDLDSGDSNFDRATIIEPRGYGTDERLCLPWLQPEIREVLLALLQRHCVLDDGGGIKNFSGSANLRVTLDLGSHDSLQALDETLVLLNRLSELYSSVAPLSVERRAHHALLATDSEPEREALLDEAKRHGSSGLMDAIEQSWLMDGRGPTRLALMRSRPDLHPAGAEAITDDLNETLAIRSAALYWWLTQPEEYGGERVIRAAVTGEADLLYGLLSTDEMSPSAAALSTLAPVLTEIPLSPDVGPPLLALALSWEFPVDREQLHRLLPVSSLEPSRQVIDLVSLIARDQRLAEDLRQECKTAVASLRASLEHKMREDRGGLSLEEHQGGGELSLGRSVGELEFSKPPDGDETRS